MKKNRVERQCPICNRTYEAKPSRLKEGKDKYCSRKCYLATRNKPVFKKCVACGKEFKSHICKPNNRFCCKRCAYDYRSQEESPKKGKHFPHLQGEGSKLYKKTTHKCRHCGKEFKACPSTERKFCSHECHNFYKKGKHTKSYGVKKPHLTGKNANN